MQAYAELIRALADETGLDQAPKLALDEWTMRHLEPMTWPEPMPGADGGVATRELPGDSDSGCRFRVNRWSPRTLADALFCAGVFHAVHRTAGLDVPVATTNVVNLVNANGLVVARPGGALRSAAYYVWSLYRHHTGRIALPVEVDGPARSGVVRQGDSRGPSGALWSVPGTVPDLDVSATRADDGSVRLALINRHRDNEVRARVLLDGIEPRRAEPVWCLGGDVADPMTGNDLTATDRVATRQLGTLTPVDGRWSFPPHSITVLTLPVK